jgi:hypothetical protein
MSKKPLRPLLARRREVARGCPKLILERIPERGWRANLT